MPAPLLTLLLALSLVAPLIPAQAYGAPEQTEEAADLPLRQSWPERSWFDPSLLLRAYPKYRRKYEYYRPDPKVLERLSKIDGAVEVVAFYGVWCRDSKREIPQLLKVANSLNDWIDFDVLLVPVNEYRKRLDGGRPVAIKKTPTLVLYINGREVGRIEERARPTTEAALLRILKARKFRTDDTPKYHRDRAPQTPEKKPETVK